jgi:glycosyltransferase involved in cell wall biosynthesis
MPQKNIFIITAFKIYKGNSASSARLMNIAKALAFAENKVYLASAEINKKEHLNIKEVERNIFLVGEENIDTVNKNKIIKYLDKIIYPIFIISYIMKINSLLKKTPGKKIIYLYPNVYISIEIICLIFFKLLNHYKIFYDFNEIRRASLYNYNYSKVYYKSILQKSIFIIIWLVNWLKYYLNEKFLFFYDGIVVISTNLEIYSKRYNNNLLRIPILSDSKITPIAQPPCYKKKQSFLICFTGQIILNKEGFDLLFEVLSKVNKKHCVELHLFGRISKSEKELITNILPLKYGISGKIKYYGMIAQQDLLVEMQKRHLLILPRPLSMQTKYGFSTKLSEYLTSGIPTLVTDVSDNNIYIKDNINGFIVKAGDLIEMEEKIIFVIENYNEIVPKIIKNAYTTAEQYFDYRQYTNKLDAFLS